MARKRIRKGIEEDIHGKLAIYSPATSSQTCYFGERLQVFFFFPPPPSGACVYKRAGANVLLRPNPFNARCFLNATDNKQLNA